VPDPGVFWRGKYYPKTTVGTGRIQGGTHNVWGGEVDILLIGRSEGTSL
jgi:hypothetical protein